MLISFLFLKIFILMMILIFFIFKFPLYSFTAIEMNFEKILDVYSPGMKSPEPIKKSRKNISAPSVTAAGAALQAISKKSSNPIVKNAKISAKNNQNANNNNNTKNKKRISDSDDEEDDDVLINDVEVIQRTPKPIRQRAIKSYVQEESEEEIDFDESEYETD